MSRICLLLAAGMLAPLLQAQPQTGSVAPESFRYERPIVGTLFWAVLCMAVVILFTLLARLLRKGPTV